LQSITHHVHRQSSVGFISACLILFGGITACGADNDSSTATVSAPLVAGSATAGTTGPGDIGFLDAADSADSIAETAAIGDISLAEGSAAAASSPIGSALAIVASVAVEVDDVRQAVLSIPDVVADHGGAIYNTDVAVGDPVTAAATITVKVPPTGLEPLIAGLGGVGELTRRTQQTEDVAAQISDTGARIETARASVDRVRELLASATDLAAVVTIEAELTVRETALETLLATQRNLADRVSLATLTITVSAVAEPEPIANTSSRGVGHAFGTGWNTFVDVLHGIALVLAYAAPLLALLLVAGAVTVAVRRRTTAT